MVISSLELYDLLSEQLGKEKAKTLVSFVETKIEEGLSEKTTVFATKEDIAKLDTKISESKAEIMKWMFGAFAMLMLAIIGLYFKH
jgi:hypothetical protein